MADSIQKDQYGPDWPLGVIVVATPGTPVSIMALVDPSSVNPPSTSGAGGWEYSPAAWEIQFTACKKGVSHGLAVNTGNIYIVRAGAGGAGNRDDYGSIVAVLPPGVTTALTTFRLTGSSQNNKPFGPYRYYIDADNANDGALVTLIIQ